MSLEDLIAAERTRPIEPTAAEAKSIWKRIRGGAGAMVPPAFDVSPATTVVTLKTKIAAALSTAVGKVVVGTAVVGTLAGGTAAAVGVGASEGEVATVGPRADAPARDRGAPLAKAAAPETRVAEAPEAVTPEVSAPVVAPPVVAPAPVAPAPVAPSVAPAPVVDAEPPVASKRRAKPAGPSTFGDEFALIRQAQRALAGGRSDATLATLAEHERRFPKGSMNEDRLALRALALCSAGRRDEGRRAAKLLERGFPRSLYADRVNEACS